MSYILDALRRADAERRRGQAPVLQDMAALGAHDHGPRPPVPRSMAWRGLLLALLVTMGVALGWLLAGPGGALFRTEPGLSASGAPASAASTIGSSTATALPSTSERSRRLLIAGETK